MCVLLCGVPYLCFRYGAWADVIKLDDSPLGDAKSNTAIFSNTSFLRPIITECCHSFDMWQILCRVRNKVGKFEK